MLQLLPNRLRTEVAIHVHLETLKKVGDQIRYRPLKREGEAVDAL